MNEQTVCEGRNPYESRAGGGQSTPPTPKYDVNIVQAENGFIVRIGCRIFVFSEWVLASEGLALYFKNPDEAYKKYCKQ